MFHSHQGDAVAFPFFPRCVVVVIGFLCVMYLLLYLNIDSSAEEHREEPRMAVVRTHLDIL